MKGLYQDLSVFDNSSFDRGRSRVTELLWRFCSAIIFKNPLVHHYRLKVCILKCFGAKLGKGVVIKPCVTITFPWKLTIGNHTWIGEGVWIDSLDIVKIGSHVCISQGAYLCTGNHDYRSPSFDLVTKPIVIEDESWISAYAVIAPGSIIKRGAVLGLQSLAKGVLDEAGVYEGVPAEKMRNRVIKK